MLQLGKWGVLFGLLILSNLLIAQNSGKLRGFVTDEKNGEALAYGNVYIEELKTGASTDEKGYFFITSIPSGKKYNVTFSYVGYQSKSVEVFIAPNKTTQVDVELSSEGVELQTIEKIGERVIEQNATDIGLQRIAIKQLESLPKGVETDVFRSLQFIPGVRSTGDVSARYYVRGGASNENLVMLNGTTVYNPFHAMGLFSVIDPDMINSIEFYKGGYGAQFGERMSSVLKITSKDGNKNNFGVKASSSYLTGKVLLEGPIPDGSFILTARKSYNNDILRKFFNEQNAPFDFYDGFFKINYSNPEFIRDAKFEVYGFLSYDELDEDDPFKESFNWQNNLFSFKWLQVYDSPLLTDFGIHVSQFKGEVVPNLSLVSPKSNEVSDITFKGDFTYLFDSKDEVGVGVHIKTIDTKLFLLNPNGSPAEIEDFSSNISLYAKYNFLRYENFGLEFGNRFNLIGLTEAGSFRMEPRISATYMIFPFMKFKAAWGLYLQEITTLTDENEVISLFEPWVIIPDYLNPSVSRHYTAGLETNLENLTINIEGYYKSITDLPALNQNKKAADDKDLVAGNGEAYGAEVYTKYDLSPFALTTTYTLSYAYKDIENWVYYPRYDSRHAFNVILEYKIGWGWEASALWTYNTGLPFTPLVGFYDRAEIDNLHNYPYIIESFYPYSLLGDKNIGRLPDYHRLDLSVSKSFEIGFAKFSLDFSVINVYNRKNIFYFKRDSAERVNMLPFLPTATIKIEI